MHKIITYCKIHTVTHLHPEHALSIIINKLLFRDVHGLFKEELIIHDIHASNSTRGLPIQHCNISWSTTTQYVTDFSKADIIETIYSNILVY